MGCLLWKIYFASVFLSIKKGSNFGPPIILYKLVDEEIGRILKISIMFCVGNCLINLVSIRPRACFFPLFSFLPLWLHYNLNPLCVQY